MMRRLLPPSDLGWVVAGSLLALGTTLLGISWSPWRVVIGILATLVLPGYALAAAAFTPRRVPGADGLVLTVGLSLVIGCMVLFVMIVGGLRITEDTWSELICSLTLAAAVAAAARSDERPRLPLPRWQWFQSGAGTAAALVLALAIASAAVVIARDGARTDYGPGFAELSLVPRGSGATAIVRVTSFEHARTTFRLSLTPLLPSLSSVSFTLRPGSTWQHTIAIPHALQGRRIAAALYRAEDASPYRFVFMTARTG